MGLRETIKKAHESLTAANVEHALIGGIALATLGINRATADVDLLIDGEQKDVAKETLKKAGFTLKLETPEVLHFEGIGLLDILLANRPLSKQMLLSAKSLSHPQIKCLLAEDIIGLKIQAYKNNPSREYQDKADIKALIDSKNFLDWTKIQRYADLFGEWSEIQKIRDKR